MQFNQPAQGKPAYKECSLTTFFICHSTIILVFSTKEEVIALSKHYSLMIIESILLPKDIFSTTIKGNFLVFFSTKDQISFFNNRSQICSLELYYSDRT